MFWGITKGNFLLIYNSFRVKIVACHILISEKYAGSGFNLEHRTSANCLVSTWHGYTHLTNFCMPMILSVGCITAIT